MTPSDKVFDILELTKLIADDLSQHDLALCCLVSKTFFNAFIPHLWHSITIHPHDAIPKFQTPEGRAGLLRNGHLIRVLRVYDPIALEPFIESGATCTNLVSLDANHSLCTLTGKVMFTRTAEMLSKGRRGSIGDGQKQVLPTIVSPFNPVLFGHTTSSTGSGLFSTSAVATSTGLFNTYASNGLSSAHSAALTDFFGAPTSPTTGLFGSSTSNGFLDTSASTGVFGAPTPVTVGSNDIGAFLRRCGNRQRDGATYLVSVLERNSQLEFLVVPFYCPTNPAIVKVAGELLLYLKEFYTVADLRYHRPTVAFSLHGSRPRLLDAHRVERAVEGCLYSTEGKLLYPLLSHYPRLRELRGGISGRVNHDALKRICLADRGLTYLEVNHGPPSLVTQILVRVPPLEYIKLTRDEVEDEDNGAQIAYDSNDNAVKEAFLRHAPTLEHFETGNCDFSKDILLALLCSSPSLRTLNTIEREYAYIPSDEVKLDALKVIETPWACNQLERFDCRILNIPRPDIVITPFDNVFSHAPIPPPGPLLGPAPVEDQAPLAGALLVAQQESHAIQQQVLKQLGQLTQLRSMRLGRSGRDWDMPQFARLEMRGIRTMAVDAYLDHDCLELSLESGLDELAKLKELEVLAVYQMAHRIGLAEVQWMVVNWPRLKAINGLRYQDYDREVYGDGFGVIDEPEHVRWMMVNRPDIQLS
ncbi:hypothetical protein BGZ47_007058 [Haplosporangium gracile]|nr:hypothetical protein BGZ47_007058 [Haplosporangium gracile]